MMEKEVKDHVKNIGDTIKITRAMQVIATTKLYPRQKQKANAKAYLNDTKQVLKTAIAFENRNSRWFEQSASNKPAYIVIAGDKGLCGDYNRVLLEEAESIIARAETPTKIYAIGYVAFENLREKYDVNDKYVYLQLTPSSFDSWNMANDLADAYLKGEFGSLKVIYTESGKYGETSVNCMNLLPLEYEAKEEFDVHIEKVNTEDIFRQYLSASIFYAIASASLAVNFKRMVAMRQATSNGEEMIEDLKIQLNKMRQDKITTDLSDAVALTFGKQL